MASCFEGDDRRTTCPYCNRRVWLEDGCPTCELQARESTEVHDTSEHLSPSPVVLNARGRSSALNPAEAAGASSDRHLICGMHRAVAEHTLLRCITAFGGLAGLLVAIQAWEDEPDVV